MHKYSQSVKKGEKRYIGAGSTLTKFNTHNSVCLVFQNIRRKPFLFVVVLLYEVTVSRISHGEMLD